MSDSRKEFEMEMAAKFSDFKPHELEQDDYGRYASDRMAHRYEGWQLALSVAPAPVAAEPVAWLRTIELSNGRTASEAYTDWDLAKIEQERLGGTITELFAAPPVQEGPKGAALAAAFADDLHELALKLDRNKMEHEAGLIRKVVTALDGVASPAQSIPAAIDEEKQQ